MIKTAVNEFPNFQAVATTLRNAKTASKNDWGAVLFHDGEFHDAILREDLEIYDTEKQKINTKIFNGKTIEEVFIELNIKVEEDCGISLWNCNDISIDNITKNYSKKNQEVTVDQVIGDKWWEKLDKTKEGRPYLELNECNIYGDLLERLIDDMVFGKITIAQYDKKHHELNQGHQHLKDIWCYKKSKFE